ncbi:hypothetical protein CUMW_044720 [Citrus unshiu]|nr:hypothetical protein CUMW_044720 [Citrus unshiu]
MRATTVNTACDRIRAVPPPIPQKYNTSQDLAEGQKRGDKKKKKRCGLVLIYLIQYFRKKQAWVASVRGSSQAADCLFLVLGGQCCSDEY